MIDSIINNAQVKSTEQNTLLKKDTFKSAVLLLDAS